MFRFYKYVLFEHTDDPLQHDGEVLQRYCHNRSVQYSYSLSPVYGEWAVIKLCEQNLGLLQCESLLETYDHLVVGIYSSYFSFIVIADLILISHN